ncbi:MAG: hypothetical protein K8H86_03500, partial [Ignavibacteriaceae bacterium]|nr:hypothetical protein [Ignavibacteriaceae bacterium]
NKTVYDEKKSIVFLLIIILFAITNTVTFLTLVMQSLFSGLPIWLPLFIKTEFIFVILLFPSLILFKIDASLCNAIKKCKGGEYGK